MTSYEFGDIVLVQFPQTAAPGRKLRPAVVVLDIGDDDLAAVPITSVRRTSIGDIPISNLQQAGLRVASRARLAKVTTVLKRGVARQIGRLAPEDRHTFVAEWNSLFRFIP